MYMLLIWNVMYYELAFDVAVKHGILQHKLEDGEGKPRKSLHDSSEFVETFLAACVETYAVTALLKSSSGCISYSHMLYCPAVCAIIFSCRHGRTTHK